MTYAVSDIGRYPAVAARLLPINNQSARETSLLDAGKVARMIAAARVATMVWPDAAFLLAFDQDADYDSPNFLWFRERFDSFLYVDRVIVSKTHRRAGLGRLLYEDLFRRAEYFAFPRVACEVNIVPPNPASDAFHADDIVDHCCHAWNKLTYQPWCIMSIGIRDWAHGF
jgi:predicted GNAT superfamily acetyltransferase